jgi:hypothetical protein
MTVSKVGVETIENGFLTTATPKTKLMEWVEMAYADNIGQARKLKTPTYLSSDDDGFGRD